jgi:hypothetical protein
MALKK